MIGSSFVVRRDALDECQVVVQEPPAPAGGEIVVEIASFGLSANNITYAETGDRLGYWKFYPARDGWGSFPVWGFGQVVASRHDLVPAGARLYGFWPPSTHAVLRPGRCSPAGFVESSPHRTSLPAAYNWYEIAGANPIYEERTEAEQMLLRPLFFTSFLLADLITETPASSRVLISSASSKTAHGTAHQLTRQGVPTIGLTSPGRVEFVASLGVYDEVLSYDQLDRLGDKVTTTLLDFAGDPEIQAAVHRQLGARVVESLSIGLTHRQGSFSEKAGELPGARPKFFFAPDRIRERTRTWGPEGLAERFAAAWGEYVEWVDTWLQVKRTAGLDGLQAVYLDVLSGTVDPAEGHVIELT
jgi:hypothetical protein